MSAMNAGPALSLLLLGASAVTHTSCSDDSASSEEPVGSESASHPGAAPAAMNPATPIGGGNTAELSSVDPVETPPGGGTVSPGSNTGSTGPVVEGPQTPPSPGEQIENPGGEPGSPPSGGAPAGSPVAVGGASTGANGGSGNVGAEGACTLTVTSQSLSTVIPTVGIVEWTTDLPGLTEASIEFGLDENYGMTAPVDLGEVNYRTLLLGMKAVGREKVISVDIWRERVLLKDDDGNRRTVPLEQLKQEVAGGGEDGPLADSRRGGRPDAGGDGDSNRGRRGEADGRGPNGRRHDA
jgi:hypothetical protein